MRSALADFSELWPAINAPLLYTLPRLQLKTIYPLNFGVADTAGLARPYSSYSTAKYGGENSDRNERGN
jgi:hypothetical protein